MEQMVCFHSKICTQKKAASQRLFFLHWVGYLPFMSSRIFVFLLLVILFGCKEKNKVSFATQPQLTRDLEDIRKRGYIEAILDNNSISYFIYRGRPMGYEYELLQHLASHLKLQLKIKVISGIEDAIDKLNRGEGDVIAFPLTVTKERTQYVSFTNPFLNTCQVLVQRRPEGWRAQQADQNERAMLRNPSELIGKEIYVIKKSSFKDRLQNLSEEIGGEIIIREDSADAENESDRKSVV